MPIPTFSIPRPFKIYPNLDFWFVKYHLATPASGLAIGKARERLVQRTAVSRATSIRKARPRRHPKGVTDSRSHCMPGAPPCPPNGVTGSKIRLTVAGALPRLGRGVATVSRTRDVLTRRPRPRRATCRPRTAPSR
jgi:hypothetical protein